MNRFSTAGMAHVVADMLTKETGRRHETVFAPRRVGDFQPFIVREVER